MHYPVLSLDMKIEINIVFVLCSSFDVLLMFVLVKFYLLRVRRDDVPSLANTVK